MIDSDQPSKHAQPAWTAIIIGTLVIPILAILGDVIDGTLSATHLIAAMIVLLIIAGMSVGRRRSSGFGALQQPTVADEDQERER